MTGYSPAEQAIRDARGLPHATGADEPPDWHNHPGMTGPDDWHAYDATGIEFTGASGAGLPPDAIYGPAPASPDGAAAALPEWWRP